MLLVLETAKSVGNYAKRERNYSNAAGVTFLKSLSTMDILLSIIQEFRHFFSRNASERLLRQLVPMSVS